MNEEIEKLEKEFKALESDMAKQKNEKAKELKKIENEMDEEMRKELKQIKEGHHDLMEEKEKELKGLQDKVKEANENLDRVKKIGVERLEQQAEEDRTLLEENVANLNEEILKAIMADDLHDPQHQKDQHETSTAEDHTKEVQQAKIDKEEVSGQHEGKQCGNEETETKGDDSLLKSTLQKLFKPKKRSPEKFGTNKDEKKDLDKAKVVIVLKLELDPITNELTMKATAEANAS